MTWGPEQDLETANSNWRVAASARNLLPFFLVTHLVTDLVTEVHCAHQTYRHRHAAAVRSQSVEQAHLLTSVHKGTQPKVQAASTACHHRQAAHLHNLLAECVYADYGVITVCPAGVLFNAAAPTWLITALLVSLLAFMCRRTTQKGLQQWAKESQQLQQQRQEAAQQQAAAAAETGATPALPVSSSSGSLMGANGEPAAQVVISDGSEDKRSGSGYTFPWQQLLGVAAVWVGFAALQVLKDQQVKCSTPYFETFAAQVRATGTRGNQQLLRGSVADPIHESRPAVLCRCFKGSAAVVLLRCNMQVLLYVIQCPLACVHAAVQASAASWSQTCVHLMSHLHGTWGNQRHTKCLHTSTPAAYPWCVRHVLAAHQFTRHRLTLVLLLPCAWPFWWSSWCLPHYAQRRRCMLTSDHVRGSSLSRRVKHRTSCRTPCCLRLALPQMNTAAARAARNPCSTSCALWCWWRWQAWWRA